MYRNLEAARAAFAAGPVAYRCQVCGREHVSGRGEGQVCLDRLFEENWWRIPRPAVLLGALPPSLHFVRAVWERERAASRAAMRACFEEPLLAMRPFRHIPRDVYERIARTAARVRVEYPGCWDDGSTLLKWRSSLEETALYSGRPPAQLRSVSFSAGEISPRLAGIRSVSGWTVAPAIPGPQGETEIACSPKDRLLDPVLVGMGNRLSDYVLLGLRYGSRAFVAVFAERFGEAVALDPLVEVREEYGCSPQLRRIALGPDAGAAVESSLRSANG